MNVISRETYAIGAAVMAVLVAMGLFGALESAGYLTGWTNLLSFLVIAVLGVAIPQLYLARADASVPTQWRFRVIILVFIVLGGSFSTGASTAETVAIWALVGVSLVGIVAYEVRAGLRVGQAGDRQPGE